MITFVAMAETVHIYTDGACSGNPGPGGYGIVMEWVGKPYKKEYAQGFLRTTNNRMELLAVIVALEQLKVDKIEVKVFSDSKYVVDAVNKNWISAWKRRRFTNVKNMDLWRRFIKLYDKFHPEMIWIKGHNNHPQNERCDSLAVTASQKKKLLIDTGFETGKDQLF
jgi:ribonuclease HI